MSKEIAKMTIKMKTPSSLKVETQGDNPDLVFMAATAVAHTVMEASNGNRKKADAVMTMVKITIEGLFNKMWEKEYGKPADPAEKQEEPAAVNTPDDLDSILEKTITDAMAQAKADPGKMQGIVFKIPAGDIPMDEMAKRVISAMDKQARKDQNGG